MSRLAYSSQFEAGTDTAIVEEIRFGEYWFSQCYIRGKPGVIIALPFLSREDDSLLGYLFYCANRERLSPEKLMQVGMDCITAKSLSGTIPEFEQLPIKLADEEKVDDIFEEIVEFSTNCDIRRFFTDKNKSE